MHALTISLYALTGVGFVVQLFMGGTGILTALRVLFVATAVSHLTAFISMWAAEGQLPASTPPEALYLLVLFCTLALAPFVFRRRTAVLAAFFMPGAAMVLAFATPSAGTARSMVAASQRTWYVLHTVSVIAGEALLVIAAVASAAYLLHERLIRHGELHLSMSRLPPLTVLDAIASGSLVFGFCAMTAGMILGGLWASASGIAFSSLAPKVASGALLWATFALCLHQRFAIGWKGRRTAVLVLFGFVLMAQLFAGINSVFPNSHGIRLI